MTEDEIRAMEECEAQRCRDEWCDGQCEFCLGGYVLLGDALAAVDRLRAAKKFDREQRLKSLLDEP